MGVHRLHASQRPLTKSPWCSVDASWTHATTPVDQSDLLRFVVVTQCSDPALGEADEGHARRPPTLRRPSPRKGATRRRAAVRQGGLCVPPHSVGQLIISSGQVILGGSSATGDLQDLSALIGERDKPTDTISIGDHGSRSLQRSTRRVPVMPPEAIRTLPFGTSPVLLRSAPPLVTDLHSWANRPNASKLRAERLAVESQLRSR